MEQDIKKLIEREIKIYRSFTGDDIDLRKIIDHAYEGVVGNIYDYVETWIENEVEALKDSPQFSGCFEEEEEEDESDQYL